MSVRRLIVDADPSTINVAEFCRLHGISTWFFWDLRKRFVIEGEAALEPKSRAPHHLANKTPLAVEDAIVAKHKALDDQGLDAGAESVWNELDGLADLPSPSTIYRILKARGFTRHEPKKAPKHSHRSFTAQRANECWQLDDTTWSLSDGTPVKILNVVDDHSRLLVASVALERCTGAAALAALGVAAVVLGWPQRILSDNARAFRDVLATALGKMGIVAGHSRPYHPQTNGKVERLHQTLKKWLERQPKAETIDELQAQLDVFRHHYNHLRRHRSLHRQTPAAAWTSAPKSGPASRPLGSPTTLHRSIVAGGRISIGYFRISLGVAFEDQEAMAVVTGDACHVFVDGRCVRQLVLDRGRRNQALHDRGGRPRSTVRDVPPHQ